MPVETFTDAVVVDGSQDIIQLRVQAHSTQNQALQAWESSAGTPFAQITHDGRLEIGSQAVNGPSAALIEANEELTSASEVTQGLQTRGMVGGTGALTEPLTWSVHELELGGSGGVSAAHVALRSTVTQSNTGNSPNAVMRAGEFKVENNQTLGKAVAVQAEISNASVGNLTEAAAFEAVMPATGTIGTLYGLHIPDLPSGQNHYAIHTGLGPVRFGDSVGIGTVPSARLHVAQEGDPLNPVLENVGSPTQANTLSFRRARNTLAAKALVNNGDSVGRLSFEAWDGSAYQKAASIEAQVAAAPGANDMPGKLVFSTTPDDSATPVAAMTINADGSVTIHNKLSLSDFSNAQHNHQTPGGGGVLDAAAIGTGIFNVARIPTLTLSKISDAGTMAGQNANNVAITGGTINGTTIGGATPAAGTFNVLTSTQNTIISNGTSGTNRGIHVRTSGNDRWFVGAGMDAESTNNLGSNFYVSRYDDNGSFITNAISINRASGMVTLSEAVTISGTQPSLVISGGSNQYKSFTIQNGTSNRWSWDVDNTAAEDLRLGRFSDGGPHYCIEIIRSSGNITFTGYISKPGGGFLIDHPLDPDNLDLRHSFIEGPRGDLIYRGTVQLVAGRATIQMDDACGMTRGTFVALTRQAQASVYLQNQTSFVAVRGDLVAGQLFIIAQNLTSTDTIHWMVVAERNDAFYNVSALTDSNGNYDTERSKVPLTPDELTQLGPIERDDVTEITYEVIGEFVGRRGYPRYAHLLGGAIPRREIRPVL